MKFFLSFAIIGLAILFTVFAFAVHSSPTPSMDIYTEAVVKEAKDSTRHAQEVRMYLDSINHK
jgi:lipopolysaccharide export LptBFGC system permease protein LptF